MLQAYPPIQAFCFVLPIRWQLRSAKCLMEVSGTGYLNMNGNRDDFIARLFYLWASLQQCWFCQVTPGRNFCCPWSRSLGSRSTCPRHLQIICAISIRSLNIYFSLHEIIIFPTGFSKCPTHIQANTRTSGLLSTFLISMEVTKKNHITYLYQNLQFLNWYDLTVRDFITPAVAAYELVDGWWVWAVWYQCWHML